MDAKFYKRIVCAYESVPFADSVAAAIRSRYFMEAVGKDLCQAVDSGRGTVRILYISSGSWVGSFAPTQERFASQAVRTFVNGEGISCLEMRPDLFDKWDSAVVMDELWKGVSASVVVFRFDSLKQLGRMIGRSKEVTDCFAGMMEEVQRVMFADTISTHALVDVRNAVREAAIERRLLAPRLQEDVLFEVLGAENANKAVSERARQCKSILHRGLNGTGREWLVGMVRVLNREIEEEEAAEESADVVDFLSKLWSSIHTKVSVKREGEITEVKVVRGDLSGYAMSSNCYIRVGEYRDYRDITESQPFTVEVKIQLGNEGGELVGRGPRFWRRWKVVEKMGDLVRGRLLLLGVADERKRILECGNRGLKHVVGVHATALGGGMKEFLYAKIMKCCGEAVRAEEGMEQVSVRVLLKLVEGLATAAHAVRGDHATPWQNGVFQA